MGPQHSGSGEPLTLLSLSPHLFSRCKHLGCTWAVKSPRSHPSLLGKEDSLLRGLRMPLPFSPCCSLAHLSRVSRKQEDGSRSPPLPQDPGPPPRIWFSRSSQSSRMDAFFSGCVLFWLHVRLSVSQHLLHASLLSLSKPFSFWRPTSPCGRMPSASLLP